MMTATDAQAIASTFDPQVNLKKMHDSWISSIESNIRVHSKAGEHSTTWISGVNPKDHPTEVCAMVKKTLIEAGYKVSIGEQTRIWTISWKD